MDDLNIRPETRLINSTSSETGEIIKIKLERIIYLGKRKLSNNARAQKM